MSNFDKQKQFLTEAISIGEFKPASGVFDQMFNVEVKYFKKLKSTEIKSGVYHVEGDRAELKKFALKLKAKGYQNER